MYIIYLNLYVVDMILTCKYLSLNTMGNPGYNFGASSERRKPKNIFPSCYVNNTILPLLLTFITYQCTQNIIYSVLFYDTLYSYLPAILSINNVNKSNTAYRYLFYTFLIILYTILNLYTFYALQSVFRVFALLLCGYHAEILWYLADLPGDLLNIAVNQVFSRIFALIANRGCKILYNIEPKFSPNEMAELLSKINLTDSSIFHNYKNNMKHFVYTILWRYMSTSPPVDIKEVLMTRNYDMLLNIHTLKSCYSSILNNTISVVLPLTIGLYQLVSLDSAVIFYIAYSSYLVHYRDRIFNGFNTFSLVNSFKILPTFLTFLTLLTHLTYVLPLVNRYFLPLLPLITAERLNIIHEAKKLYHYCKNIIRYDLLTKVYINVISAYWGNTYMLFITPYNKIILLYTICILSDWDIIHILCVGCLEYIYHVCYEFYKKKIAFHPYIDTYQIIPDYVNNLNSLSNSLMSTVDEWLLL